MTNEEIETDIREIKQVLIDIERNMHMLDISLNDRFDIERIVGKWKEGDEDDE